ncbi:MAG TPA: Gfo/Idh/MocA family oxidoreductase [Aestuariivirgaceae bacterium]|jgi:predicted dehydrogenase|nr:Gfo/Idh/MocA family oxidoreductase [Aestuariivirgaceae bacterium]
MEPVRFGVIGTARIAMEKVVPAMQTSAHCRIVAIASRDLARAEAAAKALGIPRAHGSYEALLQDPEIEAVYNPLPNHLHVPLSIAAAEAGKHVLCEKPIALSAEEARLLLAARDRTGKLIQEAFMVRCHPQWLRARELVRSGAIGTLRVVQGSFSYMNRDPANVRNQADIGGGGVYDIGCYPIVGSRFLFESEPLRVASQIEHDPHFATDRLTSALLQFPTGQALFFCSTQLVPYQRMQILGTDGRIEIEIPFNAPPDRACRIFVDDGSELGDRSARIETFDVVNQYTLQGDLFADAVRNGRALPFPLEDSVKNMRVLDAVFRAGRSGRFEEV